MRLSDKIAYINHDIDDAVRAGVLREEDLPDDVVDILGHTFQTRINCLVHDVILSSRAAGSVSMSPDIEAAMVKLREAMFELVYNQGSLAKQEERKAEDMIELLYERMLKEPRKYLPEDLWTRAEQELDPIEVLVCDYIASMSDNFAMVKFEELYLPKAWSVLA